MKYQKYNILTKIFFCLILLFFGLMSASVTHAETYTFITKWGSQGTGDGQFDYPRGIAVDSSGNVYVADTGNYRIQKFDSSGNFITKWVSDGDEQFSYPIDVDVDSSDNVYILGFGNGDIQKFDSNGTFLTEWGSQGSDDGQLISPQSIAVDFSGNVYVGDGSDHIHKFDSNGNFITKWVRKAAMTDNFMVHLGLM
jgi:DNA-binding beta-propeller fold protein YncE